jgi:F-type H+-transporting ATPase subunit epsilon
MKFELMTPASQVADIPEATFVALPGDDGDFGVMHGHMPLISTLRDGQTIEVTDNVGKKSRFTVNGAFADVQPHAVTVLAETASAV